MCNHVHILVEVTPRPDAGLTDAQLLERVRAISSEMAVSLLRKELKEAREKLAAGLVNAEYVDGTQRMGRRCEALEWGR